MTESVSQPNRPSWVKGDEVELWEEAVNYRKRIQAKDKKGGKRENETGLSSLGGTARKHSLQELSLSSGGQGGWYC